MQTDATTPNLVAPTMLGVVACVFAVVYKRMQQLPTMLGPAVHGGKDTAHKTLKTRACVMRLRGPNNVGKSWANESDIVALRFGDHET